MALRATALLGFVVSPPNPPLVLAPEVVTNQNVGEAELGWAGRL